MVEKTEIAGEWEVPTEVLDLKLAKREKNRVDLYYKMDDGLLHGSNKLQDFKQTLTKYSKE